MAFIIQTYENILVDAIHAFVTEEGIFEKMHKMLEEFPNTKILLTGASGDAWEKYNLDEMPYEVFTLKGNPPKSDPEYFKLVLKHINKTAEDVIYFEHNIDAVKSAESVGIKSYHYDKDEKDLNKLKVFLDNNL